MESGSLPDLPKAQSDRDHLLLYFGGLHDVQFHSEKEGISSREESIQHCMKGIKTATAPIQHTSERLADRTECAAWSKYD